MERLADDVGLGEVEAVYGPRVAPMLWFATGVPASLAATALWERYGAPGDAGPGRVVWPVVGVALAIVCLALVIATAFDSGRRIAVCRKGLLHRRRSRLDVVPWGAVRHLRRRSRTAYELDASDGTCITWNEELRGHQELFQAVEDRVTPLLLAAARERLAAGDHVTFDGLVVSALGLTAEGIPDPLPWDEIESVTVGPLGEARVRRRGQADLWRACMIPDQAAFRTLVDQLLGRR